MSWEPVGGGGVIVEAEGPLGARGGWSTVASLSTARQELAAAEAGGLVYAIGGDDGDNPLASVEEYDPETDTWSTVASLSTARRFVAAAEANGLVYAIGGQDSGDNQLASVEEYDPETDTWSTVASLSTAREFLGAAEADGLVYAIGGDDGSNTLASVEELAFESFVDVYSATGDTLFGIDDPNGTLLNRTTGGEVTGDSLIARDGETIAAITETNARVYRTEET